MSHPPPPYYIAIGASGSGGLHGITEMLGALPYPIDAVVLVVLHRPVGMVSQLRRILGDATRMQVVIPQEDDRFCPGVCYIGEPAQHLTLATRSLAHMVEAKGNSHRNRTIDILFRSMAAHAGPRMIGVVLSGSLDDGSRGLAAIHAAGGITMVLDPTGLACPDMPRNAIKYDGPINLVGSALEIAQRIGQIVTHPGDGWRASFE